MDNLLTNFSNKFTEKEQQFILLTMERIKEDDTEYLKTLSTEQLIKLRDNIKNICNNIFKIDEKLIIICNDIQKIKDENDNNYKLFKHYLKLNNELNSYLSMLMSIPLTYINIYKQYHDHKSSITAEYYEQNQDFVLKKPRTSPPKKQQSPSQIPPQIKLPRTPNTSQIPSQNTYPKSGKFSCYIDILLTMKSDYPFLNAIFDYGIYKKHLHMIYNRLLSFNLYIYKSNKQYKEILEKIYIDYDNNKKITKIINQMLDFKEGDMHSYYSQMHNNLYKKNIFTKSSNKSCTYTIITQNDENDNYNEQLRNFIYYMRYIQEIYIHTLGKTEFINDIIRYFTTNNKEDFENKGWNANMINEFKGQNLKIYDYEYCYSLFNFYLTRADIQNIINIKIIEKIFSINFLPDIEPFKIIYEKINISYEDLANNYNFTIPDSKNYIHIIQDNNNIYFNIFNSGVLDV